MGLHPAASELMPTLPRVAGLQKCIKCLMADALFEINLLSPHFISLRVDCTVFNSDTLSVFGIFFNESIFFIWFIDFTIYLYCCIFNQ